MTTATRCAGFRLYSRHPDRLGRWFHCNRPAPPDGDTCSVCAFDADAARRREAEDEVARAKVRTALVAALGPVIDRYPLMSGVSVLNGILRALVADIEAAVKTTGELGGSGNNWLAWRLFLGLDRQPHDPLD